MTALGYHVNTWSGAARGSVRAAHPAVLKVLSTAVDRAELLLWRQAVPHGVLIYRHYFGNESLDDVAGRVAALMDGMAPIADLVDYVETPWNESHQSGSELDDYNRATLLAVELLHQHQLRVLVGNFSVGNPPNIAADWPRFLPSLRVADGLSLHEYSAPTMQTDQGYKCLRYRDVYAMLPADCRKPLFITESSIDWGDPTSAQNGYKSHTATSASALASQTRWYVGETAKDPYVKGVLIYACGTYVDFESFNVAGVREIEDVVREFSAISPNNGGNVTTFVVGQGVKDLMAKNGDTPQSDEHYVPDEKGNVFKSETFGSKGLYQWNKQANKTVLLPFG